MEVNTQPREHYTSDQFGIVELHSCWLTIQGEGPRIGEPSVFLRLAGCNLQCSFCDTDYTSHRERCSPNAILQKVQAIRSSGLVVITGGEPLRQNIGPMVDCLLNAKYDVQIETNGTLYQPAVPYDKIIVVCSPKTPKIHPALVPYIHALKYVLTAGQVDPVDGLPAMTLGCYRPARPPVGCKAEIYVQPMDEKDPEKNKQHVEAALASCYTFNYRLCLQTHKFIGLE